MNTLKTFFLLTLLTILFVSLGALLGGKQGMTIALVIAIGMNFFSYWFSDKIVLRMYGAKEVSEENAPELFSMVRMLAQRAQLPMPKVYMMEQDQPNAFATGRNPNHAAVAVTTGILRMLTREELSGVIGHELAHVKNRDILIGTIAATIAGAISYLGHMAFFFGGSSDDEEGGGNPIAGLLMMIFAPIAALLVQMAISRSREYLADESGAKIAGNPLYLAGALKKLAYAAGKIPMHGGNEATSHLFIVSPLSGGSIANLFSTHPPIEERIGRLEASTRRH
ncbi:MAG: zinc metalloprotease HtpX [Candidatus Magnetoovum sp. WYHC-5]|nr:zinc metalloprotease HtpX [Candidatus Magnetoovum sp. WYHC-5]